MNESEIRMIYNPFTGCTIVVTGKLDNFTRDSINSKIESLGAVPSRTVTKKTNYLICGEKPGSKLTKAKQLGIPVLTEQQFLDMSSSRDLKKAEAVGRMKTMKIFPETIRQFEEDGYISISEPPVGAFYWASGEDLQHIRKFEEEYNALVYMAVRTYTTIGMMDSYLYVSDHTDEWERDRENLQNNEAMAYVYNHDDPDCSELGHIGIERTVAAGLNRIW